jgi:hypothetical protein
MTKDNFELKEIFSGHIGEASMVKSLIEDAEIRVWLKDEFVGTLAPWNISAGGAGAVKVVVAETDYDEAKAIVDIFEQHRQG